VNEILFASALEMAELIKQKKISVTEVVTAHLAQIDSLNPIYNAIVERNDEAALKAAELADKALTKGGNFGPLYGVPMTIKDCIEVQGMLRTEGTLGLAQNRSKKTATAVARLQAAGAILLGKTNQPEFGMAYETDNLIYGRTNNPYDVSRTPGGSSGGEATAITTGCSAFGLGGDYGGSVRLPAHFCGIAAIKPSAGVVPRTGHDSFRGPIVGPSLVIGPMARRIDDLEAILKVIAGCDWRDPLVIFNQPLSPALSLNQLRVAFYTDNGISKVDADTQRIVESVIKSLTPVVQTMQEGRPDGTELALEIFNRMVWTLFTASSKAIFDHQGTSQISPLVEGLIKMMPTHQPNIEDQRKSQFATLALQYAAIPFLNDVDIIISPVCSFPAVKHGTTMQPEIWAAFSYAMIYNLLGWPSVVVRAGSSKEGLPINVQISARPFMDLNALNVARFIEQEFGGWQPPPLM
jgi:amidase